MKQAWCSKMMVCNILKSNGDWKTEECFPTGQRPISFELAVLRSAMESKVEKLKKNCAKNYEECMVGIKAKIGNYNIYG